MIESSANDNGYHIRFTYSEHGKTSHWSVFTSQFQIMDNGAIVYMDEFDNVLVSEKRYDTFKVTEREMI